MTLGTLLTRAYINNWNRHLWFKAAELRGDILVVPDETYARFITNCWLKDLQAHVPGLRIIVAAEIPAAPPPTQGQSLWNKRGQAYHAKRLNGLDKL